MKIKKIIGSSLATIALAASLASGATYALFTSNSEVNIAISSGKVKVSATINQSSLSTSSGFWNASTSQYDQVDCLPGTFTNGGVAQIVGNTINLVNLTPMDQVKFTIDIKNDSNVDVNYRTVLTQTVTSQDEVNLIDGLKFVISDENDSEFNFGYNWISWLATDSVREKKINISIVLPEEAGNEYQGLSANIKISLEAIQGNGNVSDVVIPGSLSPAVSIGDEVTDKELFKVARGVVNINGEDVLVEHTLTMNEILARKAKITLSSLTFEMKVEGFYYFDSSEDFSSAALCNVLEGLEPDGSGYQSPSVAVYKSQTSQKRVIFLEGNLTKKYTIDFKTTNPRNNFYQTAIIGLNGKALLEAVDTNNIENQCSGIFIMSNATLIDVDFTALNSQLPIFKIATHYNYTDDGTGNSSGNYTFDKRLYIKDSTFKGAAGLNIMCVEKGLLDNVIVTPANTINGGGFANTYYGITIGAGTKLEIRKSEINSGLSGMAILINGFGLDRIPDQTTPDNANNKKYHQMPIELAIDDQSQINGSILEEHSNTKHKPTVITGLHGFQAPVVYTMSLTKGDQKYPQEFTEYIPVNGASAVEVVLSGNLTITLTDNKISGVSGSVKVHLGSITYTVPLTVNVLSNLIEDGNNSTVDALLCGKVFTLKVKTIV